MLVTKWSFFDIIVKGAINMDSNIKKVLKKLEDNGYEAYIVGGFVRDYLLGNETVDVDICTNALPKDVLKIFNIKKETSLYGSIKITTKKYNFDITTYRTEGNYDNRRPTNVTYVNNLIDDIKRRDFTINSLCMNSDGTVIDLLGGKKDIVNGLIKVVGDTNLKLKEDPLRILRAIRFSTVLDFKLDDEIIDFIKNNKDLIKSLSYTRKKEELDKILVSKNVLKGLEFLKNYDLLDTLEINYDKITVVPDLLGMWAQINYSEKYPFTRDNIRMINKIRKIIEFGKFSNEVLFFNDLYTLLVSSEILNVSKESVYDAYNSLPIKSKEELVIKPKDIIDIINIVPSKLVKDIYDEILLKVINGELLNSKEDLTRYVLNYKEWVIWVIQFWKV